MNLTTHLQLECKELQQLDPDSKLAFFTRQLFAKMVEEFGSVPTSVIIRHYRCISFVGNPNGEIDSSIQQNPYNLCNVRDSLKALNIEFKEIDMEGED
jgi:hypothetical protein